MAQGRTYTNPMHSNVLNSKFMARSQEERLTSILDNSPRFSPWGASHWEAPEGYRWTTIIQGKVPDTVLVRESDHAAVLEVPRYTNLVFVDRHSMAFTITNDAVPTFYGVRISQVEHNVEPVSLKKLEGSTYFPSIHRREIISDLPGLPTILAGHYYFENNHFVWILNTKTGVFVHNPMVWFNDSIPEKGFESIELIRTDPTTQVLIGSGSHIPNFVMNIEGNELLAFLRRYHDDEPDAQCMRLIVRWTERLQRLERPYLS